MHVDSGNKTRYASCVALVGMIWFMCFWFACQGQGICVTHQRPTLLGLQGAVIPPGSHLLQQGLVYLLEASLFREIPMGSKAFLELPGVFKCNGYCCRQWTQCYKFKSWMKLMSFHKTQKYPWEKYESSYSLSSYG